MNDHEREMGLIGWLDTVRVSLPLKGVECEFEVTGNVTEVRMEQLFYHDGDQAMDCTYSFPLPAEAAVFLCEMHINDRVVRAEVQEEGKARELAATKAAEGKRTMLVEMERDNLFTLSLNNVQPEDLVTVRLRYFQTTEGQGRERSLRVPFTPGVRYIPGEPSSLVNSGSGTVDDTKDVPDASRITPPRIDSLHEDAAYLRLKGVLDAGELESELSSPSHGILIERGESGVLEVRPKNPRDFPDRDFVLRWTLAKPALAALRGWRCGNYALVELTAPESVPGTEDFEQDVYFLLDQSGSMSGMKWKKAATALIEFFRILGPGDRAFATVFESEFKDVTTEPKSPSELLADRRVLSLPKQSVLGGTNLLPALKHVLKKIEKHSVRAERHASIVLITDGQVGNERAVLKAAAKHSSLRVHTFGIDSAVNDGFLKSLAKQQRGTCRLQSPQDDITGGVVALGRNMRQPILLEVSLSAGWELPGGSIADLFGGQVLPVALQGDRAQPLTVSAKLPGGERWRREVEFADVESKALSLLWNRERITQLLADGKRKEAIELACAKNLLCEGVSFVAIDEAETGAVATSQVYQPSLEPAAVACQAFGGSNLFSKKVSGPRLRSLPDTVLCSIMDNTMEDACDFTRDASVEEAYVSEHIEKLELYEAIRLRPGMYIQDTANRGVTECIQILVDECIKQGGEHIAIELKSNGGVVVERDGEPLSAVGSPSALEEGLPNQIHTGTPARKERPGGRDGTGTPVIVALASEVILQSGDSSGGYQVRANRGIREEPTQVPASSFTESKTCYDLTLDDEIFSTREPDLDLLLGRLRASALLNPKLVFTLKDASGKTIVIAYPDGLAQRLRELAEGAIPDDDLLTGELVKSVNDQEIGVRLAIQQRTASSEIEIESYADGWATPQGGIHVEALKSGISAGFGPFRAVLSVSCEAFQFLGQDRRSLLGPPEIREVIGEVVAETLRGAATVPE